MTKLLVKTFVKDYENYKDPHVRQSYGVLGGAVGIVLNIVLFLMKFVIGFISGAISITADAFNNLSDAFSSVVTILGFKMSERPADPNHPFGHGRIEYLTGLFVSVAIMLVGFDLFKTSLDKIFNPSEVSYNAVTIIILVVSVLLKLWIGYFNAVLGKKIDSATMRATATDSISDCVSTFCVIVSIFIAQKTGFAVEGYVGAVVSVLIFFAGISSIKETLSPLLGTPPSEEFVRQIKETVLAHKEVIGIHDLIVHDYGPGRKMISLHAEIPYKMYIMVSHDIIDNIEEELDERFSCESTIHFDPVDNENEFTIKTKAQLKEIINGISSELSFHDFRMTQGEDHRNLIFDVVVPNGFAMSNEDLKERLSAEVKKLDPNNNTVIKIDRPYV